MSDRVFVLGLGGQKCGSSWIQAYLNRQDGSDFGRLGEYQVWESDLGSVFARYRVPEPSTFEKLRAQVKQRFGAAEPAAHLRWRLQTDRRLYFRYFADLLARPEIRLTGDITPGYAALPAGLLSKIRSGMHELGIETRVIFSMRDPVDRIRSQLRMEIGKGRVIAADGEVPALKAFFRGAECAARSRYDQTLSALEEVFDADHRHVCFFEELFSAEGIGALSHFVGVPADPAEGARPVNAGADATAVPEDLIAEIARHYAPIYQAVHARFPRVAKLWPSARYVLG